MITALAIAAGVVFGFNVLLVAAIAIHELHRKYRARRALNPYPKPARPLWTPAQDSDPLEQAWLLPAHEPQP